MESPSCDALAIFLLLLPTVREENHTLQDGSRHTAAKKGENLFIPWDKNASPFFFTENRTMTSDWNRADHRIIPDHPSDQ